KTAKELQEMKEACRISAGALRVAKEAIAVGVSTAYIDDVVRKYIKSEGATPSFLNYNGFPNSACISVNEEVIHGIPSRKRIIMDGDIVSVDVGACYNGYHGDNAATFGVGTVSDEAQRLMDVTRECLHRAVLVALPGNRIGDIGHAVQSYAEANGFSVVRDYIGHGVGRHLHEAPEVPNFGNAGHGERLVPGMTIAIEPMINAGTREVKQLSNGWTIVTKDSSLSAHFEYSIAITDKQPIILTAE
ncbi:MAG: type I methionyl aminopeptidase, partial [Oscillospiraceae bacterium]